MSKEELQIKFRDIYYMNTMNIMNCLEDLSELKEEYENSDIYKKTGIGIYEMFNYYVKNDLFLEKLRNELEQVVSTIDLEALNKGSILEIEDLLNQLKPEHQTLLKSLIEEF